MKIEKKNKVTREETFDSSGPKSNFQIHISLGMILKNEELRLLTTLKSIKNYINSLIIYDTGSTDNTIKILKEYCENNNIELKLKKGNFINFEIARNILLDMVSKQKIDFCLLLDANDELQNGESLINFCKKEINTPSTGYLVCQYWNSGNHLKYYNIRLIKPKSGWRYKGLVHEYLYNPNQIDLSLKVLPDVIIYQNRIGDNKSKNRYYQDKKILFKQYKNNNLDPRNLFYLAQTCSCLNQIEEAFEYYLQRSNLDGFYEEKFYSLFKCGEYYNKINDWKNALYYYIKSLEIYLRVEPLVQIAKYYKKNKNWNLAFLFIEKACNLKYPSQAILFVNSEDYDYTRWHLMSLIGYYSKNYKKAKIACLKAIKFNNSKIDKDNLTFFNRENLGDKQEQE